MSAKAFWVHKAGNERTSYEDAFGFSIAERRFAVTDGATESIFADRWARALAAAFVAEPPATNELQPWLTPLQQQWFGAIEWAKLEWNVIEKAARGAFSTLLGIEIDPQGAWRAVAIGDSCLCCVREGAVTTRFPIDRSEQFGDQPFLLSSNPENNRELANVLARTTGQALPGDRMLLMTDALAQWFMASDERHEVPWNDLIAIGVQEEFEQLVATLRSRELRNDDVTLMMIFIEEDKAL